MIDRAKIIKGLESLRNICNAKSNMAIGNGKVAWAGYANTANDALAMLKEQEAVEPDTDLEGTCTCGNCGETVGYYPVGCNTPQRFCKFCPECGKAVKWDG